MVANNNYTTLGDTRAYALPKRSERAGGSSSPGYAWGERSQGESGPLGYHNHSKDRGLEVYERKGDDPRRGSNGLIHDTGNSINASLGLN
ncbi:hypothetical protein CMI45_02770 [Candidatus Pacearchaeota archaeon]|nr:hypothetical protein [Candidatus Pacearchaeota archaeon]|tara:strand:+ start:5660 stop:5929 length:270 start_codon:yes stop_codon:yes gene_type:complete